MENKMNMYMNISGHAPSKSQESATVYSGDRRRGRPSLVKKEEYAFMVGLVEVPWDMYVIRELHKQEWTSINDMYTSLGCSRSVVYKAITRLQKQGLVSRSQIERVRYTGSAPVLYKIQRDEVLNAKAEEKIAEYEQARSVWDKKRAYEKEKQANRKHPMPHRVMIATCCTGGRSLQDLAELTLSPYSSMIRCTSEMVESGILIASKKFHDGRTRTVFTLNEACVGKQFDIPYIKSYQHDKEELQAMMYRKYTKRVAKLPVFHPTVEDNYPAQMLVDDLFQDEWARGGQAEVILGVMHTAIMRKQYSTLDGYIEALEILMDEADYGHDTAETDEAYYADLNRQDMKEDKHDQA